jgi:hypothetical protein
LGSEFCGGLFFQIGGGFVNDDVDLVVGMNDVCNRQGE